MLQDWCGKRVLVTRKSERDPEIEGVLTRVWDDSHLHLEWIEVDTTVGRPGLVRIAADQIASARLLSE